MAFRRFIPRDCFLGWRKLRRLCADRGTAAPDILSRIDNPLLLHAINGEEKKRAPLSFVQKPDARSASSEDAVATMHRNVQPLVATEPGFVHRCF
jgi:hypothetical protein